MLAALIGLSVAMKNRSSFKCIDIKGFTLGDKKAFATEGNFRFSLIERLFYDSIDPGRSRYRVSFHPGFFYKKDDKIANLQRDTHFLAWKLFPLDSSSPFVNLCATETEGTYLVTDLKLGSQYQPSWDYKPSEINFLLETIEKVRTLENNNMVFTDRRAFSTLFWRQQEVEAKIEGIIDLYQLGQKYYQSVGTSLPEQSATQPQETYVTDIAGNYFSIKVANTAKNRSSLLEYLNLNLFSVSPEYPYWTNIKLFYHYYKLSEGVSKLDAWRDHPIYTWEEIVGLYRIWERKEVLLNPIKEFLEIRSM